MKVPRWSVLLLSLLLLVVLVAPATLSASPQIRDAVGAPGGVDIVVSPAQDLFEMKELEPTLEQLSTYQPYPLTALEGSPSDAELPAEPIGAAGFEPGKLPDPNANAEAWAEMMPDLGAAVEPDPAWGYSYIPPYTAHRVNYHYMMWKYYPWMTMGKMYFTQRSDGGRYTCTAEVGYTRAAWTAGHCVAEGGKSTWHTSMYFYPGWRYGSRPYGTWTANVKATATRWFAYGDYRYDIGMFSLYDKSGKSISYYTGYLGFSYNGDWVQHFHSFGYPSNLDSGQVLWSCQASTSRKDYTWGWPWPLGIGCSMGKGSSGGARLRVYQPYTAGAMNYVNGVNSYYWNSQPLEVFSAYFGSIAKSLYDWGKAQ